MLGVAEGFTLHARDAEIELLYIGIVTQDFRRALENNAAILQNVAMGCIAQRNIAVLFGQQEGNPLALIEIAHPDCRSDLAAAADSLGYT